MGLHDGVVGCFEVRDQYSSVIDVDSELPLDRVMHHDASSQVTVSWVIS